VLAEAHAPLLALGGRRRSVATPVATGVVGGGARLVATVVAGAADVPSRSAVSPATRSPPAHWIMPQ
jgi:hypothetical protein